MKNPHPAFFLALFLLLVLAIPGMAQETVTEETSDYTKNMTLLDTETVKGVLASDLILLNNDKRYRLDNIRVPVDYNQAALDELNNLLLNKKVNIYTSRKDAAVSDRYGVPIVHIIQADGVWIQDALVSGGLAWAFSSELSDVMMPPLRHMESEARAKSLGFWINPAYAIKNPDNLKEHINSFQIVDGKILNVAIKKDNAYLNFGADWKTDFTIHVKRSAWRMFGPNPQTPINPNVWQGKTVRIRGWVEEKNGPMIQLTHPEQIEFLK